MNMTDLAVLEAPFEFPEELALSLFLRRLIMGEKAWITGSYPLSLLYPFEPNDIDVFCHECESTDIRRCVTAHGYERVWASPESSKSSTQQQTYKYSKTDWPDINVICREFECVQDVWATFDLSCCEIAIVWDEEEKVLCFVGSDKFQQFAADGIIEQLDTSIALESSRRRIWKYANRGFDKVRAYGVVWKIEPQPTGFVGWGPGGDSITVTLDNLPPLTPKD